MSFLDSIKFNPYVKSGNSTGLVGTENSGKEEYNQKGLTSQGYSQNYLDGKAPYKVQQPDNMGLDFYA